MWPSQFHVNVALLPDSVQHIEGLQLFLGTMQTFSLSINHHHHAKGKDGHL